MYEQVRYVTATEGDEGQRLDNFLIRHLKGVPKSLIYRVLRQGQIRVNKKRCKPDYRLQVDDSIRLPPLRVADPHEPTPLPNQLLTYLKQRIVYEDKNLLILNKPSGVAVHGGTNNPWGIIEIFKQGMPHAQDWELVHRLDKETSGCLIIAKRRALLKELHELLREGEMHKQYLTLVAGEWSGKARYIAMNLEKTGAKSGENKVIVAKSGKISRSYFKPISRFKQATLMEVILETGRTHQIRVQAAELGHPVAGDSKYGDREFNQFIGKKGCKRLFLHANRVSFVVPSTQQSIDVTIELDDELLAILDVL